MSPFSHGIIVVAITASFMICGGIPSKETEEDDTDRPEARIPQASSSRLSRQQHNDVLRDPDDKGFLSTLDMETHRKNGEEADAVNRHVYIGLDGKPVNLTQFAAFLAKQATSRQLNRDAQWAYMCVVVVICLMMWAMWWLGGLQRCRYRSEPPTSFTNSQPLMSVHEVVRKQSAYLPMFAEPEWEEVTVYDRGTDP